MVPLQQEGPDPGRPIQFFVFQPMGITVHRLLEARFPTWDSGDTQVPELEQGLCLGGTFDRLDKRLLGRFFGKRNTHLGLGRCALGMNH